MIDGKGPWVSISLKIKWEVRDVSPIVTLVIFMHRFFAERQRPYKASHFLIYLEHYCISMFPVP